MSYQDRIDIDRLYTLVWDNETNQLLLLTKEEFESFKNDLENDYFDKGETDRRYALIDHVHPYTTVAEVNEMIVDVVTSGTVTLTGYLKKSTATGKEDYTIDQLLSEKADGSSLTSHINNSTDAHGINSKVGVSHLSDSSAHSSLFNGKVGTSHLTDSSAHSSLFNGKVGTSHLADNSAHSTLFGNKADKTGGVAQVTDANSDDYTNIGSMSSGATQQTINDKINTALGGKADSNHTSPHSTGSAFGHAKLSDTYSSYVGSASDGIGASQSSLYAVYGRLTSSSYAVKNGHSHGNIYSDGSLDPSADIVSFSESNVPLVVDAFHGNMIGIGQVPTKSIKDDTAYSNLGTSANATQHAINGAINTAMGVSSSSHTTLTNGSGRVTFFKHGKQVTCDYYFSYTTHSTANTHTNIVNVPSGYTPSDTLYSGIDNPIQNNSDATTYQTRDTYTTVEKVSDVWKLQAYSSITSTSTNVCGQMNWFTD